VLASNLFGLDSVIGGDDLNENSLYKVIIIGDSGVGKTQFYNRWFYNKAEPTKATVNFGFGIKSYRVNSQIVKVQLWDTAGQERYRALARQYYRGAHGVILMYTITDEDSFTNIGRWIQEVRNFTTEECCLLLIGNKKDLERERQVSTQEALQLAKSNSMFFLETSAEEGYNCMKAIQLILQEIHEQQSQRKQSKTIVSDKDTETPSSLPIHSQPIKPIILEPIPNPEPVPSKRCCG